MNSMYGLRTTYDLHQVTNNEETGNLQDVISFTNSLQNGKCRKA